MNPFRIFWSSVVDLYDNLFPIIGMNLIWLVLSVPVVVVVGGFLLIIGLQPDFALSIALLLAVIGPSPASVGIHLYANQLIKEERADFDVFWTGLRTYWVRSVALLGIGLAGIFLLGVNIYFYLSSSALALHYFAILWVYALLLWIMMLVTMNPLLVEQADKSIKLIVRNALFVSLGNLIPGFFVLVILLVVTALSIGITLLVALIGGALVTIIETRTVLRYIEKTTAQATRTTL